MKEKTKLEAALDGLLSGKSTEEIAGPEGLLKQLRKVPSPYRDGCSQPEAAAPVALSLSICVC